MAVVGKGEVVAERINPVGLNGSSDKTHLMDCIP
jgi:hypothetical protein